MNILLSVVANVLVKSLDKYNNSFVLLFLEHTGN